MIESFVSILENFLQVKRTELSLIELWNEQTPAAANGMPLKEYLANVRPTSLVFYKQPADVNRVHFDPCATIFFMHSKAFDGNTKPSSTSYLM